MGAWSHSILGNDTSCEVREAFIERYNEGVDAHQLIDEMIDKFEEVLEYDRTNFWLGLALVCWECKVLTPHIYKEVENIIKSKEDLAFNASLDADQTFLKKREKALNDFLIKISTERPKARVRKKPPKRIDTIYKPGKCFAYKNNDGFYIGIFITRSEFLRNEGKFQFFFMDFESQTLPSLDMFLNSKLYGLNKLGPEWGEYEYQGNVSDMDYRNNTKALFHKFTAEHLIEVGQLAAPNLKKLVTNYRGDFLRYENPKGVISTIEALRIEQTQEHQLSRLSLKQLLEEVS